MTLNQKYPITSQRKRVSRVL